ncbi:hypothetical protein, partial [Escherichia coli]|uniref:hypothetical protein n=1 Tax=Escherichia coli TaxID=562 RepID=UPI000FEF6474
ADFGVVDVETPHLIHDKEQLRRGFQLTVARWRILRFPLSESTLNFRIFLFNRTGCLCEVIHIRRVDGGAL